MFPALRKPMGRKRIGIRIGLPNAETIQWKVVNYSNFSTKGSKQWKRRIVGKVANVRCRSRSPRLGPWRSRFIQYIVWTCCFRVKIAIPFPPRIGIVIGKFLQKGTRTVFSKFLPLPVTIAYSRTVDPVRKYYAWKDYFMFRGFFWFRPHRLLTGGPFGAPLEIVQYKWDVTVRCAFPIVKKSPII